MQYLEKRGVTTIKRENFSFSTKLIIGDFLRPSGETDEAGEEKYVRMTEDMMKDEIDKVRRENGWKPRKRIGPLSSRDGGRKSNGSDKNDSLKLEEQYKLLQRLQVQIEEQTVNIGKEFYHPRILYLNGAQIEVVSGRSHRERKKAEG